MTTPSPAGRRQGELPVLGVPYDVLAWTAEWYLRPETLEAANAAVVNYHHRLPLTQAFG
nr:Tn3 family transposase [Micromonospora sonchi]